MSPNWTIQSSPFYSAGWNTHNTPVPTHPDQHVGAVHIPQLHQAANATKPYFATIGYQPNPQQPHDSKICKTARILDKFSYQRVVLTLQHQVDFVPCIG